MLALLANWRLILAGSAVVAVLAGWLYVQRLHSALEKARKAEAVATRQAQLNDASAKSVDRYTREVRIIEKQAREAQDAVRQAPGSDDVFEPAAVLCAQLERLRNEPVCTEDPGPTDLP